MKRIPYFLSLGLIMLLFLAGCGEAKIETVTSTSPDGDKVMTIKGSKNSPLSHIMLSFSVQVKNGVSVFSTEFPSNELSDETCKVNWDSNTDGTVDLHMRDGEIKTLDFHATDDTVHFINTYFNL